MIEFNIELPLNSLSFGQVGVNLLIEVFRRDLCAWVWPIGQTDLSAYDFPENFQDWLNKSVSGAIKQAGRNLPTFKLWHLNGSHSLIPSKRNILYTFHECSEITDVEKQICGLYDKVLVSSQYSQEVFDKGGVQVDYCPAFFDSNHFKKVETRKQEGVVNWSLVGKLEKRKNSHQIISAWAQKYGGRHDSRLNTLLFNPFLPADVQQRSIDSLFRGQQPFNFNPLPFQGKNAAVNELMNFCDIDISGLSGSEGWGLPAFNSACLGKQVVVLKGHAHNSWATEENSILINPSSEQAIYDGVFFNKGSDFNQGNMLCFDPQDAIKAFELAEQRVKDGLINTEGEKLKDIFTVSRTLDKVLGYLFE